MKIAIVGGGISGLTTFLFLKKYLSSSDQEHEVLIYEKYDTLKGKIGEREAAAVVGGGLGIGANGMKILHELDQDLYSAVMAQGYPATLYQMKTSNNTTLGYMKCTTEKDGFEPTVISSRQGLWDCLRERVPSSSIIFGKAIDHVKKRAEGPPAIYFQDGTVDEVDLIIGADGAKSVVKKAVLGDGFTDEYPLKFEGLMGVGGFMPSSYLPKQDADPAAKDKPGHLVFTLGGSGFVGYGACSSAPFEPGTDIIANPPAPGPRSMWWSTSSVDKVPEDVKSVPQEKIRAELIERHGDWKDPVISRIIRELKSELFLTTWTTPKLPTWETDGLILVGDAAHALPSSSGQGASQCFEDACALALFLKHHLSAVYNPPAAPTDSTSEKEAVSKAAKAYVNLRKPRVEKILDQANRMGDQKKKKGVVAEWFMYLFVGGFIKLGVMDSWNSYVFDYNVAREVEKLIGSSTAS